MSTSKKIRLDRARELAEMAGGVSGFASVVEMSQSQASQIIGAKPVKGIGDVMARRIEVAFKKNAGWLDSASVGLSMEVAKDAALQAFRAAQVVGKMDENQFVKMFVLFCNMEESSEASVEAGNPLPQAGGVSQSISGSGNFQIAGDNIGDIKK